MKNKTLAISLIGLFVLYCLLLAVLVPIIAKPMISEQARNFIHGNVEVEDIDINPLTNSITIEGLVVKNQENKTLVSLDYAFVDLDILSLVALQVNVEILELDGLQVFSPTSRLLHFPNLVVNDTAVRLFSHSVTIENAAINNLKLSPSLGKNGGNIDELLAEIEKLLITEESEITEVKAEAVSEAATDTQENTDTTIDTTETNTETQAENETLPSQNENQTKEVEDAPSEDEVP